MNFQGGVKILDIDTTSIRCLVLLSILFIPGVKEPKMAERDFSPCNKTDTL